MSEKLFVALRFTEDANLRERVYWYLADREYREGERVLAPVGIHDRLQCGRVVRFLSADEAGAPYDVSFCKRAIAPLGARKIVLDGVVCREMGGVRYDDRHYTQFKRVLTAEVPCEGEESAAYGVVRCVRAEEAAEELAKRRVCTLVYGENAARFGEELFRAVRGELSLPGAQNLIAFLTDGNGREG